MPVICVNPTNSSEKEIVEQLSLQNADLRVFLSDQMEDSFNKSFPGKKAIGDIFDDTHISTASHGAFCGVFFEDNESNLRSVFLEAIRDSSLKRILWVSENDPSDEILDIDNLAYLHHSKYENLIDQILELSKNLAGTRVSVDTPIVGNTFNSRIIVDFGAQITALTSDINNNLIPPIIW